MPRGALASLDLPQPPQGLKGSFITLGTSVTHSWLLEQFVGKLCSNSLSVLEPEWHFVSSGNLISATPASNPVPYQNL